MYKYSPEKNLKLIQERNISFEEIVEAIESGYLLEIIEHHNKTKYQHQKMYVVQVDDYVYCVPFVKDGDEDVLLKTIFPSRKAKRKFYKKDN